MYFFFKPILREAVEKDTSITRQDAQNLLHECMALLYKRDAKSLPRVRYFHL